jgi:hypothetical protein
MLWLKNLKKREESAAAIRRLRKHEDRIGQIVQKIERAARKK